MEYLFKQSLSILAPGAGRDLAADSNTTLCVGHQDIFSYLLAYRYFFWKVTPGLLFWRIVFAGYAVANCRQGPNTQYSLFTKRVFALDLALFGFKYAQEIHGARF